MEMQSLQISKAVGATVIAVCRGAAKAEALRRLGADEVIDQSADNSPLRSQIKVTLWHAPTSTPQIAIEGTCRLAGEGGGLAGNPLCDIMQPVKTQHRAKRRAAVKTPDMLQGPAQGMVDSAEACHCRKWRPREWMWSMIQWEGRALRRL